MSYKIEKGIPAPLLPGSGRKYPIAELEVGDSFLVPVTSGHRALQSNLMVCARPERAKGKKFTTSRVEDGVRIWRIA